MSSCKNAETSAGVGSRPVRSRVTRRMRAALSASGEGWRSCLFQLCQDEIIDRRLDPCRSGLRSRNGRPCWYLEGPMWTIYRSFLDPLSQGRDFACAHRLRLALSGLRHQIMRVLRFDPLDQFTFFGMPGNDSVRMVRALPQRPFREIEAEARLPHLRVGTMTTETATGQDWLHVLIEVELAFSLVSMAGGNRQHQERGQKRNEGPLCVSMRRMVYLADRLSLRDRRLSTGCLS